MFNCGYTISYQWIIFGIASLALGQSPHCPSAGEVTLKDMGKIAKIIFKHYEVWTVCAVPVAPYTIMDQI